MIPSLCPSCRPKALPFARAMREMADKLEAVRGFNDASRFAEFERVVAEAEVLARTFDALLCERCKKLGPPLPPVGEWPF